MAAYAIPSYRTHVLRAYRADAVSAVYRALQYVEHEQLNQDNTRVDFIPHLPAELSQTPQAGTAIYRITLLGATAENGGYSVEAAPSPTGPMRDDRECGVYRLNANGHRANRIDASVTTAYVARCWDGR
jgi:type IV pilus assembly protein PilE